MTPERMINGYHERTILILERLIATMLRKMREDGVNDRDPLQVEQWVERYLNPESVWP